MQKAIEVQDLRVYFGKGKARTLAAQASLSVGKGEIVALLGPSGCGKSTVLRTIAGTIPGLIPAEVCGEITVLGYSPANLPRGTIDMVLQQNALLQWRSAIENVCLSQEILGNGQSIKPGDILQRVGLKTSAEIARYPRQLSGGMKQRVSLAASLIAKAEILLMDEPFGQLDPLIRESMWRLVEELRAEGYIKTALLVTHSIEEAVVLADRVFIMVGCNPGHITGIVEVPLTRPRLTAEGFEPEFNTIANRVRQAVRGGET